MTYLVHAALGGKMVDNKDDVSGEDIAAKDEAFKRYGVNSGWGGLRTTKSLVVALSRPLAQLTSVLIFTRMAKTGKSSPLVLLQMASRCKNSPTFLLRALLVPIWITRIQTFQCSAWPTLT